MANTIDIKVNSEADVSGFRKAESATKDLGETQEKYVDKADVAEQRTLGLKDAIDGTAVVMQGPGKAGTLAYLQGWADIGSGFANFIIPVMGNAIKAIKAMTLENIKSAATAVSTAAKTVASWIAMGTTATINGIRMAAAWVLALGPIPLIIAGLAALGAALFIAWQKSETFRNIVKKAFDVVQAAISPVVAFVKSLWGWLGELIKILGKVTAPLRALAGAFNFVKNAISGAVDYLFKFMGLSNQVANIGADVVNAVKGATSAAPGRGGGSGSGGPAAQSFMRPSGGRGVSGGGGLIQSAGVTVVPVPVDGSAASRLLSEFMREAVARRGGGSVQRAFGY